MVGKQPEEMSQHKGEVRFGFSVLENLQICCLISHLDTVKFLDLYVVVSCPPLSTVGDNSPC